MKLIPIWSFSEEFRQLQEKMISNFITAGNLNLMFQIFRDTKQLSTVSEQEYLKNAFGQKKLSFRKPGKI